MDQLNCDARLKTSLLINDIIGLLILCRRNLTETERNLEEVDRKVDSLLNQFTGSHAPEFHDPFAPGDTATWDESTSLAPDPHQLPFNPTVPYSIPIQDGPIGLEELNRLGIFEGYPQDSDFNLAALSPIFGDLHTLPPMTLPVSTVFKDGAWTDPPPLMSRVRTSPLPPLTPGYDTWGPGGRWGGSGENDRGDDNFLGDGTNDHQLTEQWADTSVQRAEVSTSLAITKPNHTENNNQSESSSPAASSSTGRYGRRRNAGETSQRLAQIREALKISSTESELATLQKIIEHLGGTVPAINEPTNWITRTERTKRKRGPRRVCYEELHRLVGPPVDKLVYLRVLDSVLARVTAQDSGQITGYEPYHVFRLHT